MCGLSSSDIASCVSGVISPTRLDKNEAFRRRSLSCSATLLHSRCRARTHTVPISAPLSLSHSLSVPLCPPVPFPLCSRATSLFHSFNHLKAVSERSRICFCYRLLGVNTQVFLLFLLGGGNDFIACRGHTNPYFSRRQKPSDLNLCHVSPLPVMLGPLVGVDVCTHARPGIRFALIRFAAAR